jgi:hypothetical protein
LQLTPEIRPNILDTLLLSSKERFYNAFTDNTGITDLSHLSVRVFAWNRTTSIWQTFLKSHIRGFATICQQISFSGKTEQQTDTLQTTSSRLCDLLSYWWPLSSWYWDPRNSYSIHLFRKTGAITGISFPLRDSSGKTVISSFTRGEQETKYLNFYDKSKRTQAEPEGSKKHFRIKTRRIIPHDKQNKVAIAFRLCLKYPWIKTSSRILAM